MISSERVKLLDQIKISDILYERMYLPLCDGADTPFHFQGDDIATNSFIDLDDISLDL